MDYYYLLFEDLKKSPERLSNLLKATWNAPGELKS